jgi:Lrp/AsnC family leucine-responsive transcriptional regulator
MAWDARQPLSRVAEELDIPQTTLHQRVRKLEETGVIKGSRLIIDWEQVGLPVTAIASLRAGAGGPLQEAADVLQAIPYVQGCFSVTGEFDLLVVIRARSSEHLGELLEELREAVPGQSRTLVVLSTFFDGRIPPLEQGEGAV